MLIKFNLPPQVALALEILKNNGYESYIVGGCVRDEIMGEEPHDYDITTNALPNETAKCFDAYSINTSNMKHGTVVAAIDGMNIEITTYRIDGSYADCRHPDNVCFTPSLREDLARRDFTINAMAYSPQEGVIDPFGGKNDISNRIIRCVGEPEKRFSEDALRIMRAVRFMSVLDFSIEAETSDALHKFKDRLKFVSAERLSAELTKLLYGISPFDALCDYYSIIGVFIPEILPCVGFNQKSKYHIYDVWKHIAMAVEQSKRSEIQRLCAFFHDIGKPSCYSEDENGNGHFFGHAEVSAQMARVIMRRLRYPEATIKTVSIVILRHSLEQMNERSIKRRLNEMGEENFFRLLDLQCADNSAKAKFCLSRLDEIENTRRIAKEIIEKGNCFSLKHLAINGNDILALGYSGKEVGEILNQLLQRVIDGELENNRDNLLNSIKS